MKKSTLINLICSMVAVIVVITGIILIMVVTDSVALGKKKLILSSASAAAVYDGNPLSNSKWYLTEGDLKENHTLSVNVTGVQTTVGISENHISAKVYDENGADVTGEYSIEYRPGMLNVKTRDLTLIAESAFKLYDGTPLTCDQYTMESEISLLPGDRLDVTVEGTLTEIGEAKNRITKANVFDQNGKDVTRNYNVKTKDGKLLVLHEATILIKTENDAKAYDGTPLKNATWTQESGTLRDGDYLVVQVTGSQTAVGSSDNTLEAKVFDANDNDVTDTYDFKYLPGTLLVTPADITIQTGNGTKGYDGESLTNSEIGILTETFKEMGYTVVPEFTGSQTEVGSSENTVNEGTIQILDSEGNDVTDNFNIRYQYGTLEVIDLKKAIFDIVFEPMDQEDTKAQDIYLKETSYGDYDLSTKTWLPAKEYSKTITGRESAYYLTSYAADNNGYSPYQMTITPKAGVFALPYYATTKYQLQTSDVCMKGNGNRDYGVAYYYTPNFPDPFKKYADYEKEYSAFVHENYSYVDEETKAFLQTMIEKEGLDSKSVQQIASYIQKAAKYSTDGKYLALNNPIDQAANPTIAFFEMQEGVCRHYAQAATMLYRTLGIPARYTVGYMQQAVKPNTTTTITAERAHAWVEVYEEGVGWCYIEVTGSAEEEPESNIIELNVKPSSQEAKYEEGKTLTASQTVSGLENLSKNYGYTYEVVVSGENSHPGTTKSEVTELIIYDSDGTKLYQKTTGFGTDRFKITYDKGNLFLFLEDLTFTSQNLPSKIYDGTTIIGERADVSLTKGELDGYTYEITMIATKADAGTYENKFSVTIFKDGIDVTEYFRHTLKFGKVTIEKRVIVLEADSASRPYNGEELTCPTYKFVEGSLADGDRLSCTVVGSQLEEGESVNKIDIETLVITNRAGQDASGNYSVSTIPGKLIVTFS